jgi:CAAX protease family protein
MKECFIRDGRLRSGWRVLSFLIVYIVLLFVISLAIGAALAVFLLTQGSFANQLGPQINSLLSGSPLVFAAEAAQFVLTLVLVWLWRRWLDKKTFRTLGFGQPPRWWKEALFGAIVIAITWSGIFAFSLGTSSVTVTSLRLDPGTVAGALGLGLTLNVLVGFNEETLFRGYIFTNLEEGLPLILAIIISGLIFGAAHLLNPGANAASTFGVALFGVLAAVSYWATGRLWMAIGMHVAWNFFEGPVFGFLVSGLNMGSVVTLHVNGPAWLVGGQFGPESGALTMAPQLVLIVLVYLWGRQQHQRRTGSNPQLS